LEAALPDGPSVSVWKERITPSVRPCPGPKKTVQPTVKAVVVSCELRVQFLEERSGFFAMRVQIDGVQCVG
jgi:hypothetical protein